MTKRSAVDPAQPYRRSIKAPEGGVTSHRWFGSNAPLSGTLGRPAVVHLTPWIASEVRTAPTALAAAPGRIRRLLSDKGSDADWLRGDLRKAGVVPVIPGTRSRERHEKGRYKDRWRAQAVCCRLRDFRRVATRYDKLARNYASAVALAAAVAFWCWLGSNPGVQTDRCSASGARSLSTL